MCAYIYIYIYIMLKRYTFYFFEKYIYYQNCKLNTHPLKLFHANLITL